MPIKKLILFILISLVIVLATIMAFIIITKSEVSAPANGDTDDNMIACTMDVKLCPDGSYVGRIPPDCEFAPCPGETTE